MMDSFVSNLRTLSPAGSKYLVAVSGGIDSMVLAELMEDTQQVFGVAHVNFQLRGSDSDADEDFVKSWAAKRKIPFFTTRVETNNYATSQGLSIQMAARKIRYEWFESIRLTNGYDFVVTAHHINDSIETVLLNWARGSSLEAWMGIPASRGKIIRPLLFATRTEIEDFAKNRSLEWREDASNQTDDYQRNLIRHQVIPQLKKINPELEKSWVKQASFLIRDFEVMETSLASWQRTFVTVETNKKRISKKGLKEVGASSFLYRTIHPDGFNRDQSERILTASKGQSGKFFLSDSHRLVIDREELIISPKEEAPESLIINQTGCFNHGGQQLTIEKAAIQALVNTPFSIQVDSNLVSFPWVWRAWKPGDYFVPLGMSGRKKLSDFLIDLKIPLGDKEKVTVIEQNGSIIWVVGYRLDDRFKVHPHTREVFLLTLK
jgi:tRNA(Ile)-lysidine synthase